MEEKRSDNQKGTASRGFASMDRELQKEIARKGGQAVSQNRQHMAEIGRKGGEHSGVNRTARAQASKSTQNDQSVTGDLSENR